jgi:hypothetical protein
VYEQESNESDEYRRKRRDLNERSYRGKRQNK